MDKKIKNKVDQIYDQIDELIDFTEFSADIKIVAINEALKSLKRFITTLLQANGLNNEKE